MSLSISVQQILQAKAVKELVSITPEKTTYEALQLMAQYDIGAVAVMKNGQLTGILTERDYARKIVLHGKASRITPVGETMNKEYSIVSPATTIEECMQIMTTNHQRYVAVMQGSAFIGLVSIGDVVKNIIAGQQADIEHLERYITGI
ncbi:MAG: CBS domain-containing protein [Verrucomicrobia bacterium]|nr:CBS domain-containing protein [Verrucomicrobiota bacterium]